MGKLNEWLGVFTNVGIIAGLVLVAYQIAQTNDALEIERRQWDTTYRSDRSEQFQDAVGRIAEDPELSSIWRRGRAGESLTPDEQYRFSLLSNSFFWLQWNSNRSELSRLGLLPEQAYTSDGPLQVLVRTTQQNPGMRPELDRWLEQSQLDDFRREIERVKREMNSN